MRTTFQTLWGWRRVTKLAYPRDIKSNSQETLWFTLCFLFILLWHCPTIESISLNILVHVSREKPGYLELGGLVEIVMLSIIRSNLLRHNASHRHRDLLKE
jgi:hypothetical protein